MHEKDIDNFIFRWGYFLCLPPPTWIKNCQCPFHAYAYYPYVFPSYLTTIWLNIQVLLKSWYHLLYPWNILLINVFTWIRIIVQWALTKYCLSKDNYILNYNSNFIALPDKLDIGSRTLPYIFYMHYQILK